MDDNVLFGAALTVVGISDIVVANLFRDKFTAKVRTLVALGGVVFLAWGLWTLAHALKVV